jgi:excisionase family DNA binding protein
MAYTLATAAEAAKVTKPTVFRWIKSGKISATKAEDGTYRIEPAELHRYLDSIAHETLRPEASQQPETASPAVAPIPETAAELVALRYEVDKLKALLELERQRIDDVKAERDRWATQAERLALPAPETKRNGWWLWRKMA